MRLAFNADSSTFQFLTGTIRSSALTVFLLLLACFNSLLVQLEVHYDIISIQYLCRFNSLLVQLEDFRAVRGNVHQIVSIPYWYN